MLKKSDQRPVISDTKAFTERGISSHPSGRMSLRPVHKSLDRIQGRTDDMFIIKGVNIFPMQVEQVLMNIPEIGNNYVIHLERRNNIDDMIVRVVVTDKIFVEDMRHLHRLQKKIMRGLRGELQITPRVELVEPNALRRSEGKATQLIDRRHL
jgi:phenylacetate-CoA ligase